MDKKDLTNGIILIVIVFIILTAYFSRAPSRSYGDITEQEPSYLQSHILGW